MITISSCFKSNIFIFLFKTNTTDDLAGVGARTTEVNQAAKSAEAARIAAEQKAAQAGGQHAETAITEKVWSIAGTVLNSDGKPMAGISTSGMLQR